MCAAYKAEETSQKEVGSRLNKTPEPRSALVRPSTHKPPAPGFCNGLCFHLLLLFKIFFIFKKYTVLGNIAHLLFLFTNLVRWAK